MKLKIVAIALVGILVYSCSPKVVAPVADVKKVELTPELAEGKSLYENSCAKCHMLFPASKHTKEDWIPVLDRMAKKAKITEEQEASIYNYITSSL